MQPAGSNMGIQEPDVTAVQEPYQWLDSQPKEN